MSGYLVKHLRLIIRSHLQSRTYRNHWSALRQRRRQVHLQTGHARKPPRPLSLSRGLGQLDRHHRRPLGPRLGSGRDYSINGRLLVYHECSFRFLLWLHLLGWRMVRA